MRSIVVALTGVLAFVGFAAACSDEPSPVVGAVGGQDAAMDTAVAKDTGHTEHDASDDVAKPEPAIRCTDSELAANDKTDGGALVITFLKGANPRQYENHCATVKAGASVTFSGSFTQHPLEPAGGDKPSPFVPVDTDQPGDTLVVTMPTTAGTFGYQCTFHPANMFGAIRVVP